AACTRQSIGACPAPSATIFSVMKNISRRSFLVSASAATLAAAAWHSLAATRRQRVFVASGTPDGILAYDWDPVSGELTAAGVAAHLAKVAWITFSAGH